jgi:DNA-binding NarL/FixJ family response regulator
VQRPIGRLGITYSAEVSADLAGPDPAILEGAPINNGDHRDQHIQGCGSGRSGFSKLFAIEDWATLVIFVRVWAFYLPFWYAMPLWQFFRLHPSFSEPRWGYSWFMGTVSVLLVDDHPVVRQGLRALLETAHDIVIAGEAGDGQEAVELAGKTRPGVVVMDLALPGMNGLEATREITSRFSGIRVLMLSTYSHDESIAKAVEAGAAGYVLKQTATNELVDAIRSVHNGSRYFSAAIARRLQNRFPQGLEPGRPPKEARSLTAREAEVLQLISDGYSNKEIGTELGISVKTVEKHRQQVMNKL